MPRPKIENRNWSKRTEVLKRWLRQGDYRLIAQLTGFTVNYVNLIMNNMRYNRRVLEVALMIAKANRAVYRRVEEEIKTI